VEGEGEGRVIYNNNTENILINLILRRVLYA